MDGKNGEKARKFTERIEVAGSEALATIKKLIADGDVRRIIVRDQEGKQLLAIPMNAGVAAGGVAVLASPMIALVTTLVAVVAKVRLEVERTDVHTDATVVDSQAAEGEDAPGASDGAWGSAGAGAGGDAGATTAAKAEDPEDPGSSF